MSRWCCAIVALATWAGAAGCADRGASRACPTPGQWPAPRGVEAAQLLARGAQWVPASAIIVGAVDVPEAIDALADPGPPVRVAGDPDLTPAELTKRHQARVSKLTASLSALSNERLGVDLTRAKRALFWLSPEGRGVVVWGAPKPSAPRPMVRVMPDGALVITAQPTPAAEALSARPAARDALAALLGAAAPGGVVIASHTSSGREHLMVRISREALGDVPQGVTMSWGAQIEVAAHGDEAALDAMQAHVRAQLKARHDAAEAQAQRALSEGRVSSALGRLLGAHGRLLIYELAPGERRPGRLVWAMRLEQVAAPIAALVLKPLAQGGQP